MTDLFRETVVLLDKQAEEYRRIVQRKDVIIGLCKIEIDLHKIREAGLRKRIKDLEDCIIILGQR